MKKILFAIVVAVAFMACKGDDGAVGPMGPQGDPGEDGYGSYWIPTRFVIEEGEWQIGGEEGQPNSFFFVDKELKALTEDVYYDGLVIGYMETDQNVKQVLPYVQPIDDLQGNKWTRIYDFDYEYDFNRKTAYVRFYMKDSDFATNVPIDGQRIFNIIVVY